VSSTKPATATSEASSWVSNDEMPAWVCAVGGYEMLSEGTSELAKQWVQWFGYRRHQPIRGGAFLSHELQRYRGAAHFGFLWWGDPNRWVVQWPEAWEQMLVLEDARRELGDFAKIFAGRHVSSMSANATKRRKGRK
jgi:hypothetical protein